MKSYANIKIREPELVVRFERIGVPKRFNLVLERFREMFPLADWSHIDRAWILPLSQLNAVMRFCDNVFGSGHVHLCMDNNTINPVSQFQMRLF